MPHPSRDVQLPLQLAAAAASVVLHAVQASHALHRDTTATTQDAFCRHEGDKFLQLQDGHRVGGRNTGLFGSISPTASTIVFNVTQSPIRFIIVGFVFVFVFHE